MRGLSKGIMDKFKAKSGTPPDDVFGEFYLSVGGRMYHTYAPQECAFPFVVFHIITETDDQLLAREYDNNALVQFSIYSSSSDPAEVLGIYDKLSALYKDCTLTINGKSSYSMDRGIRHLTRDETEQDWNCVVDFHISSEGE